jgi:DNA processing protein
VDRELSRCRRAGIRLLTLDSADYPPLLREIHDPPGVLYLRGRWPPEAVHVAVVGSRRATSYGRRTAVALATGLSLRGVRVVSGGARGIDTCAHTGALEGPEGTVAILGSGLASPYPPENARLFDEIADHGALVSEFPLDAAPHPGRFPRRNRVIAGVSAAVVVVEAALRSGSLVTARLAAEQGREVLAVPGPVTSDRSAGCHRLIRDGAGLVESAEDVVEELPPVFRPEGRGAASDHETSRSSGASDRTPLTEDERFVLGLLDPAEPVHVDDLAARAPFHIGRLQAALFGLELRGAVDPLPGRYYCCPPPKER